MRAIDRHAWTNRWHHHHPGEKLLLAGGLLVVSLGLPPLTTAPLVITTASLATVWGAGVPAAALLRFVAVPGAFLLTSAPFLAVSLDLSDGIRLGWSPAGAMMALQVTLRSLAAITCLALLSLTTPVLDLVPLLRRLGLPAGVVDIMLLVYRLIFVFAERAVSGQQAQAARQGYGSWGRAIRSLGLLSAGLFQRSLASAQRLEIGLAARGFDGELKVLTAPRVCSRSRLAGVTLVLLTVAVAGLLLERLLPWVR